MATLRHNASDIDDAIDNVNTLSATVSQMILKIYPVGAVYISTSSTSPASLFGGSWTQIKDTFLLACGSTYMAGTTGGTETVEITDKNLPQMPVLLRSATETGEWSVGRWDNSKNILAGETHAVYNGYHTNETNVALDNMPPYLAVYVWKRVA